MSGLELCEAAADGDVRLVRKLLHEKKVDINSRDESNWTPLMNACYNGDTDMIMLLLPQDGLDVNATDNSGTTAFMQVALSGNLEAVQLMMEARGIDVKQKDNHGNMAVNYAKERGVDDVYQLLKAKTMSAMLVKNARHTFKGVSTAGSRISRSFKKKMK